MCQYQWLSLYGVAGYDVLPTAENWDAVPAATACSTPILVLTAAVFIVHATVCVVHATAWLHAHTAPGNTVAQP